MAAMEGPGGHLPLEFRLLRYEPKPWTVRDSLLVGLAMMQDLSTSFPEKLDREALTSRLAPEMVADLYPVGSWRDHPPTQPVVDLTAPRVIEDVPLDESQTGAVRRPAAPETAPEAAPVEAAAGAGCGAGSADAGAGGGSARGAAVAGADDGAVAVRRVPGGIEWMGGGGKQDAVGQTDAVERYAPAAWGAGDLV